MRDIMHNLTMLLLSCHREEFHEEWAHADLVEREHWGNESVQHLVLQVLMNMIVLL